MSKDFEIQAPALIFPGQLAPERASGRKKAEYDVAVADWTARLVPAGRRARARVVAKEAALLAGRRWFESCVFALDPSASLRWSAA